ncbi:hypothetical protein MMC14_004307 [Varicellaria rhodocarpa]|nr:hypothetical protein [Varicellaria rhodocarpa]
MIASPPPTDFHPHFRGIYLTKQRELAWEYAQIARRVADGSVVPSGILVVAVPLTLLESVGDVVGEDWKDYVWACRRPSPENQIPRHLAYLEEFSWLQSPLAFLGPDVLAKLKDSPELKGHRLRNGEAAHQIFLQKSSMFCELSDNCKGKVWIEEVTFGDR